MYAIHKMYIRTYIHGGNMGTPVIVVFVDIRGFTRWSEGIEAFQYLDEFVNKFYKILDEHFGSLVS